MYMKTEQSNVATSAPGSVPVHTTSPKKAWKSWLVVGLLGLLAVVSPYINPQSVKPKVSTPPAQTD